MVNRWATYKGRAKILAVEARKPDAPWSGGEAPGDKSGTPRVDGSGAMRSLCARSAGKVVAMWPELKSPPGIKSVVRGVDVVDVS
jgi:hypothetical protein